MDDFNAFVYSVNAMMVLLPYYIMYVYCLKRRARPDSLAVMKDMN